MLVIDTLHTQGDIIMATPYELRFDMYNTALDRLKESYYSVVQEAKEARDREGVVATEDVVFPTPAEAIAEAEQIMNFVNGPQKNCCNSD